MGAALSGSGAELPQHLCPGKVSTMQAVDPPNGESREWYITNPIYVGQPKRDGKRLVVISQDDGQVSYQSRSLSLWDAPAPEMDKALNQAARLFGTFVLDGEILYRSVTGSEHRSAPQAEAVNKQAGQPDVKAQPCYSIFKALYASGDDLTEDMEMGRIAEGDMIGKWLSRHAPHFFEVLPTAKTEDEKRALANRQRNNGREGEIWVRRDCLYKGGKDSKGTMVRTKYQIEVDAVVIELTPSDKRLFAGIKVGLYLDQVLCDIGTVGTGFTMAQMEEIERAFEQAQANFMDLVISVQAQSVTEYGQLWHPVYKGIREDKSPSECTIDQLPIKNGVK